MPAVVRVLRDARASTILDAPCGTGWLRAQIDWSAEVDGLDLYVSAAQGYRSLQAHDLDRGLPAHLGRYDAIVSCEGIEHLGNPLLFMEDCRDHLEDGGILIITTPNIWNPESKLKFVARGFFPGFPSLGGKVVRGTHMHIMSWSFPSLWLYFKLAGFEDIRLLDLDEPKPKRSWERLLGAPQRRYCERHGRRSRSPEEADYWRQAASDQSIYGRRLAVVGTKPSSRSQAEPGGYSQAGTSSSDHA